MFVGRFSMCNGYLNSVLAEDDSSHDTEGSNRKTHCRRVPQGL